MGTKRWDTCAIQAMLQSVGGALTDAYGNEITYELNSKDGYVNAKGVLATLHDHKSYCLDQHAEKISTPSLHHYLTPEPHIQEP